MPEPSPASEDSTTRPSLPDPWAPGRRITLDGPLEPASNETAFGFATALFAILGAFLLFQVIASPVILMAILVAKEGADGLASLGDPEQLLGSFGQEVLLTNALAQWVSFALPTLLLARLHARQITAFLRIRQTTARTLTLSLAGMVAFLPVAQWLAALNQKIPLPDSVRVLDEQSMKLIEQVLQSDFHLVFGLLVMAVTPAICEELIFRGYAQRQFERSVSPAMAIVLSGVLFGLYHLRLSQFLPLAAIGIYLAYLTWRTGSLWPAILAHFANNGVIVVVSQFDEPADTASATVAQGMTMPWYSVVLGLVAFSAVIYLLEASSCPPKQANVRPPGA